MLKIVNNLLSIPQPKSVRNLRTISAASQFRHLLSNFSLFLGITRRIIDKCKGNPQKALFFVQKTRENYWSRAVLLNFLDTDLYEREGKVVTNFKATLPAINSDWRSRSPKTHIVSISLHSRSDIPKKNSKMPLWIISKNSFLSLVTASLLLGAKSASRSAAPKNLSICCSTTSSFIAMWS